MSNGELTMFGKAYDTVGSTNNNLILLTRGDLKIRWGNKFIDLIKNGKINVDVDILKQVNSKDSISKDGLYLVLKGESLEVWLSIGGNLVNILGEITDTYVTYIKPLDINAEGKFKALSNIGFYYESMDKVKEAKLTSGLIYILDLNKIYYIENGEIKEYQFTNTVEVPNPLKIGKISINGDNEEIIVSNELHFNISNLKYISISNDNIEMFKTLIAKMPITSDNYELDKAGFAIYNNGSDYIGEFDIIKVRKAIIYEEIENITYDKLLEKVNNNELLVNKKYRIIDFFNPWDYYYYDLTSELNNIPEYRKRYEDPSKVLFYFPVIVTAKTTNLLFKEGYYCDNKNWKIEYDLNYHYLIAEETETYLIYTRGRITKLTDEYGNSGNYDFKHRLFKGSSDDRKNWYYTFNKVRTATITYPEDALDWEYIHSNWDASADGEITNNIINIREPDITSYTLSNGQTVLKLILYDDKIIFDCDLITPHDNKILDIRGKYTITGNFYKNTFKSLYNDTDVLFTLEYHNNTFANVLNCILNAPMLFNIFDKDLIDVEFECTTMSNNHFTGIIYTNNLRSTYPIKATNFNNNIINDINISAINCMDITDNNIYNIKNCNIENSNITNTTFKRNIEQLTISNATIDRCEFNDSINNATISGNLSRCQFEGLSGGILINGSLSNMTILESITPSSAQWVQELNPSLLKAIETLIINSTVIPRLSETSYKDCFIKTVTTDDGDKVVFWVQLITDDNTPSGIILMWSGDINEVPKGYGICDGRIINGRAMPDLSGRFIRMIDSGESTGPKNNSELSTNGEGTRLTYIQILNLNLPIHTHDFTITASIDTSGLSISSVLNETRSGSYSYSYSCNGGSISSGTGNSVEVPGVCSGNDNVYISIDHSHNINWDNPSISNVQITLNDDSTTYPNNKINVEPNAYALIFIMKL